MALVLSAPAAASAAPANDNFADAQLLSGASATAAGNNFDATAEPGEPNHAGHVGGRSVWWQWTAPASGPVSIDTCGSSFDTLLAVYTGSEVSALSPVAGNDDTCGLQSGVAFNAQAGQLYRIAVDGLDGETGTIHLTVGSALTVRAVTLRRRHRIDATRLFIQAAAGEDLDVPDLVFQRGRTRHVPDLDVDNEIDSANDTRFQYTFAWTCGRAGFWRWTVSVLRGGVRVSQQGSFSVPRCVQRAWYVSRGRVISDFRADFGSAAARALRCRPVGARRGSLASRWRCGLAKAGFVCRGGFSFRYTRTFQGGDLVASRRAASGSVTCRG